MGSWKSCLWHAVGVDQSYHILVSLSLTVYVSGYHFLLLCPLSMTLLLYESRQERVRNKTIKRSMMLFPPCLHAFWHIPSLHLFTFLMLTCLLLHLYVSLTRSYSSIVHSTLVSLTKDLRVSECPPLPP